MFKKIVTLCLASLLAVSLFAADITGRITLSFAGTNNYALRIDGKRYEAASNGMYLNNLRAGRHTIEVYALQRTNRRTNRPVHAATFTIRPQYDMHITIDRNGYAHFDEIPTRNNRDDHDRYDRNKGNQNWEGNNSNWSDRKDANRNERDWNRENNRWEESRVMSDYDYNSLLQQVRKQWSANSKYNTVKEAVTRNYVSTQQVRGLLELMASESYRLELAKQAYRTTADRQNYGQLYNLFSRNAQQDLDYFIRSNRF